MSKFWYWVTVLAVKRLLATDKQDAVDQVEAMIEIEQIRRIAT